MAREQFHDRESAKLIRVGDILELDPAHTVATATRRRLVPPVQVVKIEYGPKCETGVLLYVSDGEDKWEKLDAGWFFKPTAVPSPDKGDGNERDG